MNIIAMNRLFIILIICAFKCTLSYSQSNSTDAQHTIDSLLMHIKHGSDDFTIVTALFGYDKNLSEDSLNSLFDITTDNYFKNTKSNNKELDKQFRQICFSDQLFRIKCYYHNSIDYSEVQKNDSLLQIQFLSLMENHPELHLFDGSFYQRTFGMLLTHAVTTPQTRFFVDNFYKYSSAFGNDFNDKNIQNLLDLYLNFFFEKQYFNTEYGKSRLPDNSFGLLPRITEAELKEVFFELKIFDAKY